MIGRVRIRFDDCGGHTWNPVEVMWVNRKLFMTVYLDRHELCVRLLFISDPLFSFPPFLYAGQLVLWINHLCVFFPFFPKSLWRSSGHYSWLQYDRRVLDHEFPKKNALPLSVHHHLQQLQPNNNHGNKCALVLYFLIKYVRPIFYATYVSDFQQFLSLSRLHTHTHSHTRK